MDIAPQTLLAWVDALGWTLLHFLWQGAALGVVYRLARPLCTGVAARYRLGTIALVALALCPVVTLAYLAPEPAAATIGAAIALPTLTVGAAGAISSAAAIEFWLPWLVAAWFTGATVIALRAFTHWRRLAWLARHAAIPLPDCAEVLARLSRRFGITRRVRLLGSLAVQTPMLIGWLRPVILLPIGMLSGFSPQQVELIIAHELGHVRRWDYLANLMQVVIETVLFYHPVVHWVSRDVRDARESCCDDLVLALGEGSPLVYAHTLADLEELRHDGGLAAPALAASGGVLLERIRRIVGAQSVLYDPLPRSGGWPIVLLAAAGLLAMLRLHAPSQIAATLAPLAGTSLSSLSANPGLISPPAARSSANPAPATMPASALPPAAAPVSPPVPAAPAVGSAAAEPIAPVARPRITLAVALPQAAPRVGDIRETIAALPPLAAPEAPAEAPSVSTPFVLQRVQPDYPLHEKIRGISGSVALEFSIEPDGSVGNITVQQSTPEHVFDRVAIAALNKWRFASAGESGRRYTQSFTFAIGAPTSVTETCREVIGSHICRHVAADEESDLAAAGVLELSGHK